MTLDKLQKLNLKNKIIASLAGFALALISLVYFIVIPTIKDIQAMGRDIEEQRIDLEKKYVKGHSLRQLTENLKKIQPKLNLLDQIFINKNRELEFITAMESEADKAKVSQKINLNSPPAAADQTFRKSGLQLSARGGFSNQLRYLLNLESLTYYVNVKSLELAPAADNQGNKETDSQSQGQRTVNMFIDADAYWE